MTKPYHVFLTALVAVILLSPLHIRDAHGFAPMIQHYSISSTGTQLPNAKHVQHRQHSTYCAHDEDEAATGEQDRELDLKRRHVLLGGPVLAAAAGSACTPLQARAASPTASLSPPISAATDPQRIVDLTCLQDLPAKSASFPRSNNNDIVRIYFCRHGQTENNRLRKVQGARVDPDINDNGIAQATNLGKALHNIQDGTNNSFIIAHSPLRRAQQTASIVGKELGVKSASVLPNLKEIDFGAVADGQPVAAVQSNMMQSYTMWSVGNLEYRPDGGGESGTEVVGRTTDALYELVELSQQNNNHSDIIAVSHSAYLRVLLGLLQNEPLIKAAGRKIYNGSVTVVDVNVVESKQQRLLDLSTIRVVRVNEFRHLPSSTLQ